MKLGLAPIVRWRIGSPLAVGEEGGRIHGDLHLLLDTRTVGEASGFVESQWHDDKPRPVYYIHRVGQGDVLYLNRGHCRGHYDMRPLADYYRTSSGGAGGSSEYYELRRRGVRYCAART